MDTNLTTRKIRLFPQGDKEEVDRAYKYLRDGMEVQSYMMNMCISALYTAKLNGASKEEIKELSRYYSHVPTSKKGSPYSFDMSKYPTGLPIAGSIPMKCKQKLDKACKDGLMYGKVSLPTFKKTCPLMVHNDFVCVSGTKTRGDGVTLTTGFYHDYETPMDLVEALEKEESPKIHIKFANKIVFDVVLGNPYKSRELRETLAKVFSGEYEVCDSSIGFDKKTGKNIELNLSLQVPVAKPVLNKDVTVGVDLGLAVPVMFALNSDPYERGSFGSYDSFTKERIKIQSERRRIQKQLKTAKGGHGRKDKLEHLEKIQLHERNFAHTFNHQASSRAVEFARKHNAAYINIEDLGGFSNQDRASFVLRNWSYYELQSMIEYKAARYGITVRKVEPAYTSQTCSFCGQRGMRPKQDTFICTNPECECHKKHPNGINADFNAARTIAQSVNFAPDNSKKAVKTAKTA